MKTYIIPTGSQNSKIYYIIKFLIDFKQIYNEGFDNILDDLMDNEGKEVIDLTGKEEQTLQIIEKYIPDFNSIAYKIKEELKTI